MGLMGKMGPQRSQDACWCDDWKESEPVGMLVFE